MRDPIDRVSRREPATRAEEGGLEVLEDLYRKHGTRMKSVAANLLGNLSDAEDAVQESFVRIHRGLGGFRRQSRFGTWAYRILVNVCHDLVRKRRRDGAGSEAVETAEVAALGAPGADHPLRLALERALRELSPRRRMAFVLFEIEGFRHSEVAEIMRTSESNSKQMVFVAKKQLRDLLRERDPRP